ncbi:hypothetical protein C2G38_2141207 [Gigaspora rosea]|uniref:TLDc domain-containing protein n=1 Tax=Gigaspora rosea TaxID=44941 RepID=A0A397VKB1_9GLOM|nr:hypothetical protein C2G38_2141207 [Gigaspora rosea]
MKNYSELKLEGEKEKKRNKNTSPISLFGPSKEKIREKTGYLQFCTTNDPGKVLNDINFDSISENAMISLLKRDHFGMGEVQMWDNVLKWGLTQNPTLLTMDPTKWTADDFKVLRASLQQFLPLIGFHEMTSHQFFEKVSPFSKIFEPRIYEELVQYFTLSDENVSNMNIPDLSLSIKYLSLNSMVKYIDSCILSTKHAALIAIWIQQVEQTVTPSSPIHQEAIKIPYNFKLLLRGSRDRFSPLTFHKLCDNKPNTVVIMKIKDTEELIGGYNPIKWKSTKG